MDIVLDDKEARVIGCLIEKQLATPEYYPLSLNALTNACNQKTNRDPVTSYDEQTVEAVLDGLAQKDMVNKSVVGRVPKYEELLTRRHNLVPRESSIICVLLLRGPQTVGEIRGRTARLHAFDTIEDVLDAIGQLESWDMVTRLPRLPGHKEARYSQLLCGPPQAEPAQDTTPAPQAASADDSRLEALEEEVSALRQELVALKDELERFKAQFE